MKVLILGSGGREHALALKLAEDDRVENVFVSPGNPGMDLSVKIKSLDLAVNAPSIAKLDVNFVVVGSENYLYSGIVDECQSHQIPIVGPTQAAAQLEKSKVFAKEMMKKWLIPTASFFTANNSAAALDGIHKNQSWPGFVVKASGPAQGKGVFVTNSAEEASSLINQLFLAPIAGMEDGLVIEEKLPGKECSLFYACLGDEFKLIGEACDYKRLNDGDSGPNTGGMGAYSPVRWLKESLRKKIEMNIVGPTLNGMKKLGSPFKGILFLGLIINDEKFSLLEYNVRFGDPETQTFLPLLQGNFVDLLSAMALGDKKKFSKAQTYLSDQVAVHVVKTTKDYATTISERQNSQPITLKLDELTSQYFFAGVKREADLLVTNGGRVFGLTACSDDFNTARDLVYKNLKHISFSGEHFRNDIAQGIITREAQ